MRDTKGNEAHYTSAMGTGYFQDYYDASSRFALQKFVVTGKKGDETAPEVTSIKVVNKEQTVCKLGVLQLQLGLKEEGSGITSVEVEYECTSSLNLDVNSRRIHRFSVEGYEIFY